MPFTADELTDIVIEEAVKQNAARSPVPLPTSIRVGYLDFAVIEREQFDNHDHDGLCDSTVPAIYVRAGLDPARRANVLFHEVLHAAFTVGDLSDGCAEEKVVAVLANVMTAVWRDNPALVQFMEASFGR